LYSSAKLLSRDFYTQVYLRVDPVWQGKLEGLCGNFNHNKKDDYKTVSGIQVWWLRQQITVKIG